ncbi:MAG: hypothetical protein ACLGHI_10490 [Gammaproteobacteria bacterium]
MLPLLVAIGAADGDTHARHIEGGLTYDTLSMDSYAWGLPQHAIPERREAPSPMRSGQCLSGY